jgi:hypothetical protein
MPNRLLRWDDPNFVHNDMIGDPCAEDCVTLVDDYGSLSASSMTWPRRVWESLAEHILWERDRRKAEAAKQPKRWFVVRQEDGSFKAGPADPDASGFGWMVNSGAQLNAFYVIAKDAREAELKAKEADLTFGAMAREYFG